MKPGLGNMKIKLRICANVVGSAKEKKNRWQIILTTSAIHWNTPENNGMAAEVWWMISWHLQESKETCSTQTPVGLFIQSQKQRGSRRTDMLKHHDRLSTPASVALRKLASSASHLEIKTARIKTAHHRRLHEVPPGNLSQCGFQLFTHSRELDDLMDHVVSTSWHRMKQNG